MEEKTKSIVKEYLEYFGPCVLMAIATQTANIIDKTFIGNLVSPLEMGAANVCMPVSQFVYTLSVLIGVGASATISVFKGKNDKEECNRVFGNAILWSLVMAAAFFIFLLTCSNQVLSFLLRDKSIQNLARDYYMIFIWIVPFRLMSATIQNISRSDGFPKIGSFAVIISNCCNVFFNWLFMGPFKMGVRGAAFGTLICFIVEFSINLSYFFLRGRSFRVNFKGCLSKTGTVLSTGFPACIGTGLITFKLVILNNLSANISGEAGLIVMAVSLSCLALSSMFSAGANNAMIPLAGKYYGAKDEKSFKSVIKVSLIFLFAFTTLVVLLLEIFAGAFSRFHGITDEETLSLSIESIRIFAISLYGNCFTFFMIYLLPVKGEKVISTVMSVCEGFVFIIPLCFLLSKPLGYRGIWISFIITEVLTAALYFIWKAIPKRIKEK